MTGMLASVNSLAEALIVLEAGVDIIDLKQPAAGALGALDTNTVAKIVACCGGLCPISATIGDLPMQADIIYEALETMAATGVDYIKIGFFPNGNIDDVIGKLAELSGRGLNLIAVLFADQTPDFSLISELKQAGFKGVMLDTMDKDKGSLPQVLAESEIARFVGLAKAQNLLCGLAGSLRLQDVVGLLPLTPDYLGFRGALCVRHKREGQLDKAAVLQIKQAVSGILA